MDESTTHVRASASCALAAIGNYLRHLDLLGPIRDGVRIAQKTVKFTPFDKLTDVFLLLLTGAHRMVEINTKLRPDAALCEAFGRSECAEQSVVQDTLDACTKANVDQMQNALKVIFRAHSRAYRHSYRAGFQVLDIDLSGRVCGQKAELATKGYFAHRPHRKGRQEGRVLASLYGETVVTELYSGNTNTAVAFFPLVEAAESVLGLTAEQRARTVLRVDSGGGTVECVNACLRRGYQVHCKDVSAARAANLAKSVAVWYDDPASPGRQVGLVTVPAKEYEGPVVRVAVRCPKKDGTYSAAALISTLSATDVLVLTGQSKSLKNDERTVLLAYVHFYDGRGGAIETAFREDSQSAGRRNKKRFFAQAMLLCLESLAHNVLVWAKGWLQKAGAGMDRLGLQRLIRDVLSIPCLLRLDDSGYILNLTLNRRHPYARKLEAALRWLLAKHRGRVCLGEI